MQENDINKNLLDKQFRNQLRDNPTIAINKLNNKSKTDVEFKVVTNTKNIVYVVFPNYELVANLDTLQAGVKASTAGSIGSAGSASTLSSEGCVSSATSSLGCTSTLGSAGTLGTIGSAGTLAAS